MLSRLYKKLVVGNGEFHEGKREKGKGERLRKIFSFSLFSLLLPNAHFDDGSHPIP
jgi:hypothetical protein